MMWTRLLLICGMVLAGIPVTAQVQNVRLNREGADPEEVTIAINPTNPDNIIAGANLAYYFYSMDGGENWTQSTLPSGTWGDPCVLFDRTGRAYIANLVYGWDAIIVRRSDDGGATWSDPVKLFGPSSDSARAGSLYRSSLQDKEWLATDLSDGPFGGYIYAAWTDFTKYGSQDPRDSSVIVFARSTDRGVSFEPYVRVSDSAGNAIDSDETMEGAVPAVGPDGTVYLAWAGPRGIYFDRSTDAGETWGEDRIIADQPGGWDFGISGISRSNGLPITLADVSEAPTRGTVYVNWIDIRNGDPDVFIMYSTDGGETWSDPVRVNDDAVGNGKSQFFTWATVDPVTGELSVVYYDRRRYESDSTDVYLARSVDGGRSFTNQRISTAAFLPTPFVFFGDYNGIAAYNGRIRPIWTKLDQGQLSVHTALIDPEPSAVQDAHARVSSLELRMFPQPLTAASGTEIHVSCDLPVRGRLQLRLYDMMGRECAQLYDEISNPGAHTVHWNAAALRPGVYLLRAALGDGSEGFSATAMLTVLR
ncbi:glycoside hydrolase [bacterium]|nr:glycoside hydrolase [bacterium]